MRQRDLLRGAATVAALAPIPAANAPETGGPRTDGIARLRQDTGKQVGMGAPASELDYGQRKGPERSARRRGLNRWLFRQVDRGTSGATD
jgi:hypothetical protein